MLCVKYYNFKITITRLKMYMSIKTYSGPSILFSPLGQYTLGVLNVHKTEKKQ